jgi:glycosyltransferase involved in cell wall biosynthesis
MRLYEPAAATRFHRVIAVSETDRNLLRSASPQLRVDVVPNGVDTVEMALLPPPAADRRKALIFVGALHYRPCIDAAQWLIHTILPLLRRHEPEIEVWIVGKEAAPEVQALAGPGVFVASSVPDVKPYYAAASVAVVPLRAGGGSRLKILEAMALGRPVVSTTLGAEGLDVRDGRHLLIADQPEPFAAAILRLMRQSGADELRQSLIRHARSLVESQYDWEIAAAAQLRIYEELTAKG